MNDSAIREHSCYDILEKAKMTRICEEFWLHAQPQVIGWKKHSWGSGNPFEEKMLNAMHKLVLTPMFLWIDPRFLYSCVRNKSIKVLKVQPMSTFITEWEMDNSFFHVIVDGEVTISNKIDGILREYEPESRYDIMRFSKIFREQHQFRQIPVL